MAKMSGFDGKYEFTDNPKSATIFNRSLTIHSSANEFSQHKPYNLLYSKPSIERNGSIKKLHDSSFESVKGKVKKLCSLFESPKPTNSISLPPIERFGSSPLKTSKLSSSPIKTKYMKLMLLY